MEVGGVGGSGFTCLNAGVFVLLFSSGAKYCLEFVIPYVKKMQRMTAEIFCGTMSVSVHWKHSERSSPRIFCVGQYSKDYGIWQGGLGSYCSSQWTIRSVLWLSKNKNAFTCKLGDHWEYQNAEGRHTINVDTSSKLGHGLGSRQKGILESFDDFLVTINLWNCFTWEKRQTTFLTLGARVYT